MWVRNSISSSSLHVNSRPRWNPKNKSNSEGRFLAVSYVPKTTKQIWIQNRKTLGPVKRPWWWWGGLAIACIFLTWKEEIAYISSLPLSTLPQIPHLLAKLFINPSTNLEIFFPDFAQANHPPHSLFPSSPVSASETPTLHSRSIFSDRTRRQALVLLHHSVLGTKHSFWYLRSMSKNTCLIKK